MSQILTSKRASTTLWFAVFAAMLTIGVMTLSKRIQHTMVAAVNKQAPLRY